MVGFARISLDVLHLTLNGEHVNRRLFDHLMEKEFKRSYMNQIIDLQSQVYEANKAKGFWDDGASRNKGEAVALINSELYEALEAHRKGRRVDTTSIAFGIIEGSRVLEGMNDAIWKENFDLSIKDTYEDELADAIIRILDYTGGFGIELTSKAEIIDVVHGLSTNVGEAILSINREIIAAHFSAILEIWSLVIATICELALREKINLFFHIEAKLKYNTMRAHKHGKSY